MEPNDEIHALITDSIQSRVASELAVELTDRPGPVKITYMNCFGRMAYQDIEHCRPPVRSRRAGGSMDIEIGPGSAIGRTMGTVYSPAFVAAVTAAYVASSHEIVKGIIATASRLATEESRNSVIIGMPEFTGSFDRVAGVPVVRLQYEYQFLPH
jgi:hypothetical protein